MNLSKRLQLIALFMMTTFVASCAGGGKKQRFAINTICDYGEILLETTRYEAGETVNFEIFSTEYTKYLKGWDIYSTATGSVLFSNVTSFVMPNENITIEGKFERYETKVKTISHRGINKINDSITEKTIDVEVPNTIEAFKRAATTHVYGMETDVHKTKDGIWVCNHDKNYYSGGNSIILAEKNYNELLSLPIDNEIGKTATICKLEDYLKLGKKYNKLCLVEIKEPLSDFGVSNVLDLVNFVKSVTTLDLVKFISFYPEVLEKCVEYDNDCECQYLLSVDKRENLDNEVSYAIDKHFDVSFEHSICDSKYVTKAHKSGIKVNVWTINNPSMATLAIDKGVDYLTSDSIYYTN